VRPEDELAAYNEKKRAAHEDAVNAALKDMGLPRTRNNYLFVLFGGESLPEDWGPHDEMRNIPSDLQAPLNER
jgi:hypothetical protein